MGVETGQLEILKYHVVDDGIVGCQEMDPGTETISRAFLDQGKLLLDRLEDEG